MLSVAVDFFAIFSHNKRGIRALYGAYKGWRGGILQLSRRLLLEASRKRGACIPA